VAVAYTDTMIEGLKDAQRKQEEAFDDSLIDLNRSIHTEPFSHLKTDLREELNASKQFDMLLEAAVLTNDSSLSLDNESVETSQLSLQQLIDDEKQKSKNFEQYLTSLLEI